MTCEQGKRCGRSDCDSCRESVLKLVARINQYGPAKKAAEMPVAPKCVHLGITVANLGGCRTTYECERGHGKVRPCVECRSCEDFSPDDVV